MHHRTIHLSPALQAVFSGHCHSLWGKALRPHHPVSTRQLVQNTAPAPHSCIYGTIAGPAPFLSRLLTGRNKVVKFSVPLVQPPVHAPVGCVCCEVRDSNPPRASPRLKISAHVIPHESSRVCPAAPTNTPRWNARFWRRQGFAGLAGRIMAPSPHYLPAMNKGAPPTNRLRVVSPFLSRRGWKRTFQRW